MDRYLEKLDITDDEAVTNWYERFLIYESTNDKIDKKNRTDYYLSLVGKEAYDLLKNLAFPKPVRDMDVADLHALLVQHLRPVQFETCERAKFHNLVRSNGESFRTFLLRLQQSSARCNFGAELEVQLRDRIVAGVNDVEVQRRLLQEQPLTFQRAKTILLSHDDINSAVSSTTQVLYGTSKPSQHRRFKPANNSHKPAAKSWKPKVESTKKGSCDSCGGSHMRSQCKFREAVCYNCDRKGHVAKVCRAKRKQAAVVTTANSFGDGAEVDVRVLTTSMSGESHLFQGVRFLQTGNEVDFIIDTGSPVSFLPISKVRALGFKDQQIRPTDTTIRGVSGHQLSVLGCIQTPVSAERIRAKLQFLITEEGPCVLGLDGLRALNVELVLNSRTSSNLSAEISKLIASCSNCKGGMNVPPVHLEVDSEPIFRKARPVPLGLRPAVESQLNAMESSGVLVRVPSSAWATPIVTPLKTNGVPRICGDFRVTVNTRLRQAATTTWDVDEMFQGLEGCKVFSKIDLTNAFLQVPLDEESQCLTTINTMWGLFRYRFLPFGLSVSPAVFQQVINGCLEGLPGVRSFQDDILVFGETMEQHESRLLHLLHLLLKFNIQINANKSVFCAKKIKYLGYYIDGRGISPDAERIGALQKAPKPATVQATRSFLGFVQYYAKFVPHFATLAKPLFDLISEDSFSWGDKEDQCYDELVYAILNGKVLASYQPGAYSELICDASDWAIGAVLEQGGRPVICVSRLLTKAEKNYAQTQKEALAIFWATRRLHKYLFGAKFKIVTDHRALQFIFNPSASIGKTTSAMLQRWALALSAYDYDIEHRSGGSIPHADYLSRHAHHEVPTSEDEVEVLSINPLPIDRNRLIEETRKYYGPVLAGVRKGWSSSTKKRFPELFQKRDDLSVKADGVVTFNDRPIIPPSLRRPMLQHLHDGHLGRDKMVSLARLICWWPSLAADITTFGKGCQRCQTNKPNTHPTWKPWPVPFQAMQRVHGDYCGPFFNRYYILVLEDAYSKFPEAFITTSANADFTREALQKFFAREGIPQTFVTDNGSHFKAKELQDWLRSLGCYPICTAPRHPASNGLAENFVKTLKIAIKAAQPENLRHLHRCVDNFLLQYRNAIHPTTRATPAFLFKGRNLRSSNLDTTEILFFRGNDARPSNGLILAQAGERMFRIVDREDGSLHVRHRDQIQISSGSPPGNEADSPTTPPASSPTAQPPSPPATPNIISGIPDNQPEASTMDPVPSTSPTALRRSTRQRRRPARYDDFV
jgi:transposase InsO family protein